MTVKAFKIVQYITQVAVTEIPLIKLLTALSLKCGGEVPEDLKLAEIINYYIENIPDFEAKCEDESQENYDKLYDEFLALLDKDVQPVIDAAKEEGEQESKEQAE